MTLPKLRFNHSTGALLFTGVDWGSWRFGLWRVDMAKAHAEVFLNMLRNDPEVQVYRVQHHQQQEANHGRRDRDDVN